MMHFWFLTYKDQMLENGKLNANLKAMWDASSLVYHYSLSIDPSNEISVCWMLENCRACACHKKDWGTCTCISVAHGVYESCFI